jgi:hypothetical protein
MSDYGNYRDVWKSDSVSRMGSALVAGMLAFLFFVLLDSVWVNRIRYAKQYSVDMDRVFMEPKPHDCDFIKAPIGMKHCHFDKSVVTQPPQPVQDEQVIGVYINWTKVQD